MLSAICDVCGRLFCACITNPLPAHVASSRLHSIKPADAKVVCASCHPVAQSMTPVDNEVDLDSMTLFPGVSPSLLGSLSVGQTHIESMTLANFKVGVQAVIDKVRQRVSPEDFAHFKQQSGLFMRGEASAQAFHSQVVSLGLAALLPDLAALCPDATKRTDLLEVHRTAFIKEGATKVPH